MRRTQIKPLRHLVEGRLIWHSKIPASESTFRVAADVSGAIGSQAIGRVVFQIEAHAEKMSGCGERGVRSKLAGKGRKVAGNTRAEIWQRAAGVDERDQQLLAAKLVERDRVAILVAELEVGNFVARRRNMERGAGAIVRPALSDNHDVIENHIAIRAF